MRVLVAGATGYLGRYVVQAFKKQGYWVRALVRDPRKLDQTGHFLEPPIGEYVDEVFVGEVTKPETLTGVCDGIDVVFSSVGLTRQSEGFTFREVDYLGNLNLLHQTAGRAVKKFIYVSVFNAHEFEHLAIIKAHEDFVRALRAANLPSTVVRPTGYYSDMSEVLKMARSGWVFLIGRGENQLNPIHGADLAQACLEAIESPEAEIPVGGPEVLSHNQIAALAFEALGRRGRVLHIPPVLARAMVALIRPFAHQTGDLAEFFVTAGQSDGVAPARGDHRLKGYFEELVSHWNR